MIFEQQGSAALWIAIITGVFSVLVALVAGILKWQGERELLRKETENKELRKELASAEDELKLARERLELKLTLSEWSRIDVLAKRLMKYAGVESILFIRGWNGIESTRFATAIHQIRSGRSIHYDYIHYPVGEEYNFHLIKAEREGVHFIRIRELDDGHELAELYRGETPAITETAWAILVTRRLDKKHAAKDFISVSTFKPDGFSEEEKNLVRRACYELQGIFEEKGKRL